MTIGETLKALRTANNMTQEEVADALGYTRDYIKKLEKRNSEPSYQALEMYSKFFNCNLTKYILALDEFDSIEDYNLFRELKWQISNKNINAIENLFIQLKDNLNFSKGEPKQLLLYAEALIVCIKEKDFNRAINLCIEGLTLDIADFNYNNICNQLFTDTSYSLLICLAGQYLYLNDFEKAKFIVESTYFNFQNVVFNRTLKLNYYSFHIKKMYIIATNNFADIYFREKNFIKSLELCEEGILLCNKYETLNSLEILYKLKFENLYKLERLKESQAAFEIFKSLCLVKNRHSYYKSEIADIKLKYPLITL